MGSILIKFSSCKELELTRSRDNFVRLAESRTTKILKDLELLGNLSNTTNYSFTDEDVRKIFSAINGNIKNCESKFKLALNKKSSDKFKL